MESSAANELHDVDVIMESPQPERVEENEREENLNLDDKQAPEAKDNKVENQQTEDPLIDKFIWKIENFSGITSKKLYSNTYETGDYKWRILIFPKGINTDFLSMYLNVADADALPYGWTRFTHFSLAVLNELNIKFSVKKETQHQFNARDDDWGFTSFMPLGEFYDPSKGFLLSDTCVIQAEVAVYKGMAPWLYDSRKETGFVGLKNQGATCYMNSLLQMLYHIPCFRKVVYQMPTNVNDMPSASISLALQSLFYKLQYNNNRVATKELTKSLGWGTYDAFVQQDAHEFNRVLCEKLEEKMKGTAVEGALQQLFEGHHMTYFDCINVDYQSSRRESFYDLQLDVKGCHDVYASFNKYVAVEHLDGDNKYSAGDHGLQVAQKRVSFIDFPPVLQLHLKRFEYDAERNVMVKINDLYMFPFKLDLDRNEYLSPSADRRVRNLYTLYSVLIHSGSVHGGHYYAFIQPTLSRQWYKFDDERVTKEDIDKAKELYGGEETNQGTNNTPFKFIKESNAYMLVYIRESDKDKIMCHVDDKEIVEHLRVRLKREQEEKDQRKKEKAEAHLFTIVKVARDEDFLCQIGKDVFFDLVDFEKVKSFRVQKLMIFNDFKEEVAKEFGIPVQFQHFWLWAKRQNHTCRPNRPLTQLEEAETVGLLRETSNKVQNAELRLFLEDLRSTPLPNKETDDILLFFKLYDPEKEELRYVGRLFLRSLGRPTDILTRLREMAGCAPDEDIELYEEIKFDPNVMCRRIEQTLTFRSSQLGDGDIVCLQKSFSAEARHKLHCPDVQSFFEYRHNLQVIHFRSLQTPNKDAFCLQLSKLDTYDVVVEKVAHQLGVDDPSKIRLTSYNCYTQQPKPHPIQYRGADNLLEMLLHYSRTSDILYYEVLDMPLSEFQGLKTLHVAFRRGTNNEMENHYVRLPNGSIVADLLNELKSRVQLSRPHAELRLLEVLGNRIFKIFPSGDKIGSTTSNYWTLRAEEIPEEEKNLGLQDRLIQVCHFMREEYQNQLKIRNFGEPFLLVIHANENLAKIKIRIQKKLLVSDQEFSKWRFALVLHNEAEYLGNSETLFSRFQTINIYPRWQQYLGMDHIDNNAPKTPARIKFLGPKPKPVNILN